MDSCESAAMEGQRIARIIVGLAFALTLAVLAVHPRLRVFRKRWGVSLITSAGLPFLALGALFANSAIGILTADALRDLQPAFEFCLGWIGFSVGMLFDVRVLNRLPRGLDAVVALESLPPATLAAGFGGLCLWMLGGAWEGAGIVRESLVLAACAAPSARVDVEPLAKSAGRNAAEALREVTRIDDVASIMALGFVGAWFRPSGTEMRWQLPNSAWLLVTLGLGVVCGVIAYIVVRTASNESEETALLVGSVALTSGVAGYLSLSVPAVCAIAGALMANLPTHDPEGLRKVLREVERPMYLVFLLVVGASWRPFTWQAWVMAIVFCATRVGGKGLGVWFARRIRGVPLPSQRSMWMQLILQSPISYVSIVAAATFYRGQPPDSVRWVMSGVIIGSILAEVLARIVERGRTTPNSERTPPTSATVGGTP